MSSRYKLQPADGLADALRPAGRATPPLPIAESQAQAQARARRDYGRPWRRARLEALERAGYRCERCNAAGVRLEVDHIVQLPHGSHDQSNLMVLCNPCHVRKTRDVEAEEQRISEGIYAS